MKAQIKPNRSACLVTAFAMAMDIPVETLIEKIGHDGSEIKWPQYPAPYCYRAIAEQEIIDVILGMGWSATMIDAAPFCYSREEADGFELFAGANESRVQAHIDAGACVLILDNPAHSVAANIAGAIDPDTGEHSPIERWFYRIKHLYVVRKAKE